MLKVLFSPNRLILITSDAWIFLLHSTCVQVLRINSYKAVPVILEDLSLFDVNAIIMLAIFNYCFGCGI